MLLVDQRQPIAHAPDALVVRVAEYFRGGDGVHREGRRVAAADGLEALRRADPRHGHHDAQVLDVPRIPFLLAARIGKTALAHEYHFKAPYSPRGIAGALTIAPTV